MKVSELMHQGVIVAQVTDSIRTVAHFMKEYDIGGLPVVDNGELCGFVTDRDIVLGISYTEVGLDDPISVAMSPEVVTISPDSDVTSAAMLMEDNQISRLVVAEGQNIMGMITLADLALNVENRHLKAEIMEEIKH